MLADFSQAQAAIAALILVIFTFFSFRTRLLTARGIALADTLGVLAFLLGGFHHFIALSVFYAVAETATSIGRKNERRHERRNTSNVLGNAGPAMIALLLGQGTAFFGAVSAALADTVSSEAGMLSRKKPRLITSMEKVEKGTDGGITLLGLSSGFGAALLIGLVYYFGVNPSPVVSAVIVGAGFVGSIVDSILGALFERKGMLNNTQVNFIASSSGALTVFLALPLT